MLSEEKVEELLKKVSEDADEFPGMTFEQGIHAALQVVLEETPLDEFLEEFTSEEDDHDEY